MTLPEEALLFRTAAGHFGLVPDGPALSPVWGMPRAQAPAGATPCSTVEDLLRFARLHLDGGIEPRRRRRSCRRRRCGDAAGAGRPAARSRARARAHWGLGWMLFDWGGRRVIGHDGGTVGQHSSLRILPDEDFAVAVLTNTSPTGGDHGRARHALAVRASYDIEMPAPAGAAGDAAGHRPGAVRRRVREGRRCASEITLRRRAAVAGVHGHGAAGRDRPGAAADAAVPGRADADAPARPAENFYSPMTFSHFEDGKPRYFFSGAGVSRRVD